MTLRHIALTTMTNRVDMTDLAEVAAALQRQVTRDFGPVWGISATVDALPIDKVPVGYWPIVVMDDVQGADGLHRIKNGTPYAIVEAGPTWSLTASHECLEMLVDPRGELLRPAQSIVNGQERVEYLVEVCDPCQAAEFAYPVNGVLVSDFYTPAYFDPVPSQGVRYSFSGKITAPLQVLPGGYLSWQTMDGQWHQVFAAANGALMPRDLPAVGAVGERSLREMVDAYTPDRQTLLSTAAIPPQVAATRLASGPYSQRFVDDIHRRIPRPPVSQT